MILLNISIVSFGHFLSKYSALKITSLVNEVEKILKMLFVWNVFKDTTVKLILKYANQSSKRN